jgi:hypothetical protein
VWRTLYAAIALTLYYFDLDVLRYDRHAEAA